LGRGKVKLQLNFFSMNFNLDHCALVEQKKIAMYHCDTKGSAKIENIFMI
jgi:hypothetical protein